MPGSVTDLVEIVREVVDPDVELVEGPSDHLFALHKRNAGVDLYWVVNDTPEPRTHLLRFKAKGRPEKWEAPTGKRSPLFYETQGNKTLVRLALGPWDAAYVVFDPTGADATAGSRGNQLGRVSSGARRRETSGGARARRARR